MRVFFQGDDIAMQMDYLAEDVMAELGSQTRDIEETPDGPTLAFC